jgi:hypothetical protein
MDACVVGMGLQDTLLLVRQQVSLTGNRRKSNRGLVGRRRSIKFNLDVWLFLNGARHNMQVFALIPIKGFVMIPSADRKLLANYMGTTDLLGK